MWVCCSGSTRRLNRKEVSGFTPLIEFFGTYTMFKILIQPDVDTSYLSKILVELNSLILFRRSTSRCSSDYIELSRVPGSSASHIIIVAPLLFPARIC